VCIVDEKPRTLWLYCSCVPVEMRSQKDGVKGRQPFHVCGVQLGQPRWAGINMSDKWHTATVHVESS
jgi:hypothetical protein